MTDDQHHWETTRLIADTCGLTLVQAGRVVAALLDDQRLRTQAQHAAALRVTAHYGGRP